MFGLIQSNKKAFHSRKKDFNQHTNEENTEISSSTVLHFNTDHVKSIPALGPNFWSKSSAPLGEITAISIHVASDQEKLKNSVCLVDDIRMFDKNEPHVNGLYDLRMGPSDVKHYCATCSGGLHQCPKHNGAILFLRYKYNVCFISEIFMMLNVVCHNCHQIRIAPTHRKYKEVLKITNPAKRLNELSKYTRKINFCGNKHLAQPIDPREFIQYLIKRKLDPDHTPYRGCGALQRVYVVNKKEPLNIRCFDRKLTENQKKHRVRKDADEDMIDEDEGVEGEDNAADDAATESQEEDEDTESVSHEDDTDEDEEGEDSDEEETQEDVAQEETQEEEELEEAGENLEAIEENEGEAEEQEEDGTGEEAAVDHHDDEGAQDAPDVTDQDEDKEEFQEDFHLNTLLSTIDQKITVTSDPNLSSLDQQETQKNLVLSSTHMSYIAVPYQSLDQWFQTYSGRADVPPVPLCCLATSRFRDVQEKLKKSMGVDFDKYSEYMFTPNEAYGIFSNIPVNDYMVLGFGGSTAPSHLCTRVMMIVPAAVQMRAGASSGDMQRNHGDSDILKSLKRILTTNREVYNTYDHLVKAIQRGEPLRELRELHKKLLGHEDLLHMLVSAYIHRDHSGIQNSAIGRGKVPSKCLVDGFLTKYGIVRGQLPCKRTNHSARSTISPAINLDVDQIGTPEYICMKATQNEMVNPYNIRELQQLVNNGPFVYPGAKKIFTPEGQQIDIQFASASNKILRVGSIVERHQLDEDYVVMNRQPTLHRPSMMAHRVKVSKGLPFLLSPMATTPYNADYDGDEMNMHVPQTYHSRVEAREIMSVNGQMVSQQDKCIIGAKQNGIIGTFMMTDNRRMYTHTDLCNTVMMLKYFPLGLSGVSGMNGVNHNHVKSNGHSDSLQHLPLPAVWKFHQGKYQPLWTGKQLVSLAFPAALYYRHGELSMANLWNNQTVCILNGQLLSGQITGTHIACGRGVIWQTIWTELGPLLASHSLSDHARIVNFHIFSDGFSACPDGLVLPKDVKKHIQNIKDTQLLALTQHCLDIAKTDSCPQDAITCRELDIENDSMEKIQEIGKDITMVIEDHHHRQSQHCFQHMGNSFWNLVVSKTKGSNVHLTQAEAMVGQQLVQAHRPLPMFGTRSLPHHRPHSIEAATYGFISSSFINGQNTLESFFSSQSANEAQCHGSTVVANVGYLHKRLAKALEDENVLYDATVRSVSQISSFSFGEHGFDPSYLQVNYVPWLTWSKSKLRRYFQVDSEVLLKRFSFAFTLSSGQDQQQCVEDLLHKEWQRIDLWMDRLQQFRMTYDLVGKDLLQKEAAQDIKLPIVIERLFAMSRSVLYSELSRSEKLLFRKGVTHWMSKFSPLLKYVCDDTFQLESLLEPDVAQELLEHLVAVITNLVPIPTPRVKLNACLYTFLSVKHMCVRNTFTVVQALWIAHQVVTGVARALIHPGEMVGITAAQNASEPTMQMTFNTFHVGSGKDKQKEENSSLSRLEEIMRKTADIGLSILRVPISNHMFDESGISKESTGSVESLYSKYLTHRMMVFFIDHIQYQIVEAKKITDPVVLTGLADLTELNLSRTSSRTPSRTPRRGNPITLKRLAPSLKDFVTSVYNVWNREEEVSKRSASRANAKFVLPEQSYAPKYMHIHLNKAKLLDHGLTIYDTLQFILDKFKNSSSMHHWIISPMKSAHWVISIRFCSMARCKEYTNYWKKVLKVDKSHLQKAQLQHQQKKKEEDEENQVSDLYNNDEEGEPEIDHNIPVESARSVLHTLQLQQENEIHDLVMRYLESDILKLTVLGNSKISSLSIDQSQTWRYTRDSEGCLNLDLVPCTILYMKATVIKSVLDIPGIDISKLYINHICDIEKYMDVHAAELFIFREIKKLFKANGQPINDSWIWVLAHFMVRKGELQAYTRTGFNENPELGFLKKMSFEKILQHMMSAAQSGETDTLSNIISSIMVGKIADLGTRLCTAISKIDPSTLPSSLYPLLNDLKLYNEKQLRKRMMPRLGSIGTIGSNHPSGSTNNLSSPFLKSLHLSNYFTAPDYSFLKVNDETGTGLVLSVSPSMPAPRSLKRNHMEDAAERLRNDTESMTLLNEKSAKLAEGIRLPAKYSPHSYSPEFKFEKGAKTFASLFKRRKNQ